MMLDTLVRASIDGAIFAAMVWILSRTVSCLPAAAKAFLWWCVAAKFVVALVWTTPVFVPLLPAKLPSPAKLPATPEGYVPAVIPDKLAFDSVASPDEFVEALPTEVPLRLKLMDLPLTPAPLDVSVAESVVVPPYVPDAAPTASDVVAAPLATSAKF